MSERIPYSCQQISEADIAAVVSVLRSPFLTQGPEVPRFEAAFAEIHGAAHAVAVANATAALHIACLALGAGPGDAFWTSPISFVASANCALYCGASVDFVDIDPLTRNMSIEQLATKLEAAARTGTLPKIVIPVDFGGLPCDLSAIRDLADRYGFAIVEDASHAIGATIDGVPLGSRFADITVFSFHPVKIITTGEGGMCVTQDGRLAERLRRLRSHGVTRDAAAYQNVADGPWYYEQLDVGFNYRMTDFQAALGTSQLSMLKERQAQRERLAARYDERLATLPLKLPARVEGLVSAHHLYVVEIDRQRASATRGEVFGALAADNIGVNVHYIPIHTQPEYRRRGFKVGDFPASEAYYADALTLPLFPALTDAQQDRVVAGLAAALHT